ncbi:MAG: nucleotidyl transferase AbiEii/AbiGii toxin family protein [Candidatus Lokiarchaeota archaeon]|nr:nucleotidyl transferase AbiEii/AbiGii toxin family protein [Candidatus Lokiarchaeota archaeon]
MIDKGEIFQIAKSKGLLPSTIEKDYVLSWILMGIQFHEKCKTSWIFKGGTCLKKCFFKEYRFSEDLDFTLKNQKHLNEIDLKIILEEISDWIYENSGIEIPSKKISVEFYNNPQGFLYIQGKMPYLGPIMQKQRNNLPTIKLDLSIDEKISLSQEKRNIYYQYSDKPEFISKALTYCFEELFAEKVRALSERARPRDLYDVVHLYNNKHLIKSDLKFLQALDEKSAFKKIPRPKIEIIKNHSQKYILISEWENMLKHQLTNLRSFEYYWNQLPNIFKWLDNLYEQRSFFNLS